MSLRPGETRRAIAALGSNRSAVPTIGSRSLHQYWALLMPHFRGILLPPQSHTDGAGTQWAWREPADNLPLTGSEIATVRKRLASAQLSLADPGREAPAPVNPRGPTSILPQVQARMSEVVAALAAKSDPELAPFIVRSERGLMLHSWGLSTALTPFYPDTLDCEISGTVLVADAPGPDHQVLLENAKGSVLARTRSDAAGNFRFPKITSGRYRVRAVSTQVSFPPEGVTVDLEHTSVTGLELRDNDDNRAAAAASSAGDSASPSRRRWLWLLVTLIPLAGGGGYWWWTSARPAESEARSAASHGRTAANPPNESSSRGKTATGSAATGAAATRLPADARGAAGGSSTAPLSRMGIAPRDSAKPRTAISGGLQVTQLGAETSAPTTTGTPSAATGPTSAGAPPAASPGVPGDASPAAAAAGGAAAGSGAAASPSAGSAAPGTGAAAAGAAASASPSPSKPPPKPPAAPPAASANTAQTTPSAPPNSSHATSNPTSATDTTPSSESAPATTVTSTPDVKSEPDAPVETKPPADEASEPIAKDRASADSARTVATHNTDTAPASDTPPPPPPTGASSPDETRPAAPDTASPAASSHRVRFHATPWRPRLVQDSILPTRPTRIGEDDTVDVMRERLFHERQLQLPVTLKNPAAQCGFAIEFPAAATGAVPPRWRDHTGAAPADATVLGTRAEFSWPSAATAQFDCTLLADDGRELAHITGDPRTGVTLLMVSGVHGWPWIAIERAPADNARIAATAWAARLDWQALAGASLPSSWRRDDHWLANRGHRLNLTAGDRETGPIARTVALVDQVTGWSIVTDLEVVQESPARAGP